MMEYKLEVECIPVKLPSRRVLRAPVSMSDQVKDEKRQAAEADDPWSLSLMTCVCLSRRKFNDPFCRKAEYLFRYQNGRV